MEPTHNGKPISFYSEAAKKGQKKLQRTLGIKKYKALKSKGMKGKTWTLVNGHRVVQDLPKSE